MEDKFFNVDEEMIEYSEMSSFDFSSGSYLACVEERKTGEYSNQPYTFKYGTFDVLDMIKSMFYKVHTEKN